MASLPQGQDRLPDHAADLLLEGAVPLRVRLEHLPELGQGVLQGGDQQPVLAAEVVVHEGDVATGPGGHLPHGQLPSRAGGQHGLCGLDQGPPGITLGPPAPARRT